MVTFDGRRQAFRPSYIVTADEDVYVPAEVALLGQNAVAKGTVSAEKSVKSIGDGSRFDVEPYLNFAAGERFEMTTKMNGYWHFQRHCVLSVPFLDSEAAENVLDRQTNLVNMP